jgi:hypothetical protein
VKGIGLDKGNTDSRDKSVSPIKSEEWDYYQQLLKRLSECCPFTAQYQDILDKAAAKWAGEPVTPSSGAHYTSETAWLKDKLLGLAIHSGGARGTVSGAKRKASHTHFTQKLNRILTKQLDITLVAPRGETSGPCVVRHKKEVRKTPGSVKDKITGMPKGSWNSRSPAKRKRDIAQTKEGGTTAANTSSPPVRKRGRPSKDQATSSTTTERRISPLGFEPTEEITAEEVLGTSLEEQLVSQETPHKGGGVIPSPVVISSI